MTVGDVLRPSDAGELSALVSDARGTGRSLQIVGAGSRRGIGRPVPAHAVLDLGAFRGVRIYEPEELVLTAGAATPIAEIEALLERNGQRLAFDPPDLGPLWGSEPAQGTIGGALSIGLGGPRRVVAGGPRDHFLGFNAVNGWGEAFSAGGRVMKNVTGFDLPKLMAGAFGTLAVLTEVTLKVVPKPQAERTLAAFGLREPVALARLRKLLGTSLQVTGAAYLPPAVAEASPAFELGSASGSITLVRLETASSSIAAAVDETAARLSSVGVGLQEYSADRSQKLWQAVGNGTPLSGGATSIWRLSIAPASAPDVAAALRQAGFEEFYFDWGGGAVWLAAPPSEDAGAATVRAVVDEAGGGHATLLRAPPDLRLRIAPLQPLSPALARLTAGIKRQFDPAGIFNPGRMYEGI